MLYCSKLQVKSGVRSLFRVMNSWLMDRDFDNFVAEKWCRFVVQGWGCIWVKEKLKLLKKEIKEWNTNIFGNIDDNISNVIEGIKAVDVKGVGT